jgi:parallel beta-helix repeat protein
MIYTIFILEASTNTNGVGGLKKLLAVIVAVCFLVMLAAAFSPPTVGAEPSVIRVPQDYTTIKQALNASNPGDTIIVSEGTYREGEIWITKPNLTLKANGTVVVDGLREGWVFYVIVDNVDIKGFTVKRSAVGWQYAGICLDHAHNCTIENNTVISCGDGIFLYASHNNMVVGSNASFNNGHCVSLYNSDYNAIINNTAMNSDEYNGIYLGGSDWNVLIGNTVANNKLSGIRTVDSIGTTLIGNTAANNKYGISLGMGGGNVLRQNNMTANKWNFGILGEYLWDFMNDVDSSNRIDGKGVYYSMNQDGVNVDSTTFPDLGCIAIINASRVTVRNITVTNNWDGVLLAFVANSTVENVNVANNHNGIYLHGCSGSMIVNNSASGNEAGIELYGGRGGHTIIGNHVVNGGEDGIQLGSGSNNQVLSNIIINHSAGINVVSDYSVVRGNLVARNTFRGHLPYGGIALQGDHNIVYENNIVDNELGMYLCVSAGNTIYHNNFVNNVDQAVAGAGSIGNLWDSGYLSGGNYWSDYNGTDCYRGPFQNVTGSDGFGDAPYTTPYMNEDNQDRYPLIELRGPIHDIHVLSATTPANVTRAYGDVNISVTVQNRGELAETFVVTAYCDGQPIETQRVDGLAPGKIEALTFKWSIIDALLYTSHLVSVEASIVLGEHNITNNVFFAGTVYITIAGDVNGNGKVDIYDVVMAADAYGNRLGEPGWNSLADLAPQWGVINIYDIVTIMYHYGETYHTPPS